ncbi:MAG: glycosyltransferase [Clostridium sp.]|nr:glycosyltransferase [Clostridium sp.]
MKLSIITINRNNAEGLERTMRSVIGQTCRDFEYIVVDGASTDRSVEVIQTHADRLAYWVSEPDKGVYNAMNKGVAQAHGEYCLFINSGDELAHKDVVKRVLPRLCGADFYAGDTMVDYGRERRVMKSPYKMTIDFILRRSVSHPATFTHTCLLTDHPYNEENKIVSDWELLFSEWIFNNRNYERINELISVFYNNGISATEPKLVAMERKRTVDRLLSPAVQAVIMETSDLDLKIKMSLHKSPIARDWKILRNSVKYLFKDMWHKEMK